MASIAGTAAMRPTRLRLRSLGLGAGALIVATLAAIMMGPVDLDLRGVVGALVDRLPGIDVASGLSERQDAILWQLRIPRVALGGLVGAALAMSGAAYQGVFRNPLADPYLLGAAAGAGLGATLAIAYLPEAEGWIVDPLPMAAFAGAIGGVFLAYALGRSNRDRSATTLILAGVAVASFLTALQTFFQQRHTDTLQEVYAWILGRLATGGWSEVRLILPYLIVSGGILLMHRRLLDVMSVGDAEVEGLGVRAQRVRLVVVAAATLATAAAVAVSGLIGFVGIIVPHTIRLVFGVSYKVVLPLSILFGAAFMIAADLLARTMMSPAELPIGVVTAFFGAPFFVLVLRASRRMEL